MIELISILFAIILLESQAPAGPSYWPRYLLEVGLVAGLIGMDGIVDNNGRPVINYCKKCGRAYPGGFHKCHALK